MYNHYALYFCCTKDSYNDQDTAKSYIVHSSNKTCAATTVIYLFIIGKVADSKAD